MTYHPGKAYVVADALSRAYTSDIAHIGDGNKELIKELLWLVHLGVRLDIMSNGGMLVPNVAK